MTKQALTNYLTKTGDGSNLTAAFEEATTLEELTTGEKLSSILGKIKLAVKNLKSLIGLIGTTDISTIGDGTITGGLSDVNGKLQVISISPNITAPANAYTYCDVQIPDGYRVYGVNTLNNSLAIQATPSEFANVKRVTFYNAYSEDIHIGPIDMLIYKK